MTLVLIGILVYCAVSGAGSAVESRHGAERIFGGANTTIQQYPFSVSMLREELGTYVHTCGGSILTTTAILSAANCYSYYNIVDNPVLWRARVGSTYSNSGGTVHIIRLISVYPTFDWVRYIADVAVVRTTAPIVYTPTTVAPAYIAGPSYTIPYNQSVIAIGWGQYRTDSVAFSPQLRHVQVRTFNQTACTSIHGAQNWTVTDLHLCTIPQANGEGPCRGDTGSPIIHKGVIVGIFSYSIFCAVTNYPNINTRISSFSNWIQSAAAA